MNVLLLLSHSIEEYDQVRLLSELGYSVFSIGAYSDPANPGDDKRPALPDVPHHPELAALCHAQRVKHEAEDPGGMIDWAKADLHPDVIDWADVIIVHHFPEAWIGVNWPRIRHKRVVWRTVGQSNPILEDYMATFEGLEVVRYSPAERRHFEPTGHWAGEDTLIRFYKDPDEWHGWTGVHRAVLNVTQNLVERGQFTGFDFWREATEGLPTLPIGPGSDLIGGPGAVSYCEMRRLLRQGRCYLYTGTQPASYTLGLIEAMMTGIPVVSIGPGSMWAPELFEGHEITQVWHERATDARSALIALLDDVEAASALGAAQRARAIALFGMETIGAQWREYLG